MKIKILFMKIVLPFFLFLTYETLQSQTVIKERVILKPNLSNQNFQNDQTEMEWGFIPGCATNRSKCAGFSYYQSESVNNFYRMKINSGNAQFARCYSDGVDLYGNSLVVSGYYLTLVNSFDVIFSGMNIGLDTAYIGISVESITQNELVIFEVRNYSICILPNNFYVSTEDSLAVLTTGEIISSIAEIKPGSHADDGAIPPEELKLNLDIIKGASLGDIEVPERNFLGKSICDVDHDEGRLKFNFVANGNISKDVDTAIVRVSSSFKNMEDPKFQDFIFVVYKYNPIELIFSKPTINTWDSTNITIKKRDISGELIDFPADQLFNIKIIDGADFSILYSGTRGWYSTNFNDVSQEDLKLYSFETINDTTKIKIYVETFVDDGIIISSIREKNVEPNLKKILSNTKINAKLRLYGYGEISIVRSGARLNVSFAKNPISPGEQTKINIEGIDDWGNPITFPPEQTFYLYIWNGNQYGELYSASTGQSGEAIIDAPEEFFFNAADSIDADTAYAEIYVETEYDAGGGVYKIASDNNRKRIKSSSEIMKIYTELKQNKTKEIEDKSRNKITALAGFQSASEVQLLSGMGELMISEGGDCKEETVECDSFEPQKINESAFSIVGENQQWQWIADNGQLKTTFTGFPCKSSEADSVNAVAITKPLFTIGGEEGQTLDSYDALTDIVINVCLDNRDPQNKIWQFNVGNIRIPILIDICTERLAENGYFINLEDGANEDLLRQNITDCLSFNNVMFVLNEFWMKGIYQMRADNTSIFVPNDSRFWFSSGLMAHENAHKNQLIEKISEKINGENGLPKLRTSEYRLNNNEYKCPEEAVNKKKADIIEILKAAFKTGSNLKGIYGTDKSGVPNCELTADAISMDTYIQIFERIKKWAKKQSWWNELNPFCSEYTEN